MSFTKRTHLPVPVSVRDDAGEQPVVVSAVPHVGLVAALQQVLLVLPQRVQIREAAVRDVEDVAHRPLQGVAPVLVFGRGTCVQTATRYRTRQGNDAHRSTQVQL